MMPKAQCYYEILKISETATTDDVKRAYKKEALAWHPDKNQLNPEEAHAKFQAILKAYETLSDSREREWYDRHKDQILSGGDKTESDSCLDLFQYFSSNCYANFDDESDGFYTIYRNVFDKIAEEECQAIQLAEKYAKGKVKVNRDRSNERFPTFGDSNSSYEEVVRPFYAFWSAFCTNLTFDNLDKYNTTEAENRRIVRAMEKENKKVKDAAKKERNTNVRNLVEFIKKRDKRLKAHKLLIEQQNELNRKKTAEKQRQQRERGSKDKSAYKPTAYFDMDDVEEQLRQLENEYEENCKSGKRARRRRNYSDDEADIEDIDNIETQADDNQDSNVNVDVKARLGNNENDSVQINGSLQIEEDADDDEEAVHYCPACNKEFRTMNAFVNHEASKKHKQNVQKLTKLLKTDEAKINK